MRRLWRKKVRIVPAKSLVGSSQDHGVHRGQIATRLEPDYTREELRELRWIEVPEAERPDGVYYAEEPVNRWGPWN